MRLHTIITVTLCLLLGYDLAGQTRSPEAQLKAAQHKEQVEGDLKGAIEQYKQLIAKPDIPRSVAAAALLGLAQSHEKLGASDARAIYERIIRDYADQTMVVAAARERVNTLASSPARGLVARQASQLPSSVATLALLSDGRLAGTEWDSGDLVLIDPFTGAMSHVVEGDIARSDVWAEDAALSPDRRQLAYQWFGPDRKQNGVLRVLSMEKGAKPRTLVDEPAAISNIHPIAWRTDATAILVCYEKRVAPGDNRPAGRGDFELAWVSVDRGGIKPLKTFEWWHSGVGSPNSIGKVSLSPDGQWIAYTVPERQGAPERSIFVMRADGSGERRLVSGGVNDQPIWTADGSRLVFLSDRSGDPALWSVFVGQGREYTPTIIKNGVGRVLLHGMLASDLLVYSEAGLDPLIVAEFDPLPGSKSTRSLRTVETLNGLVPAWSPDGRYIAYKRRTTDPRRGVELVVRRWETGELRTYTPRAGIMGMGQPSWYLDGTVQAITRSGVRLKVGGVTLEEVAIPPALPLGFVSPDGRTLYAGTPDAGIEIFDVSSGTRAGTISIPPNWRPAGLSPDGRTFALLNRSTEPTARLAVIGVDGSGFRELSTSLNLAVSGQEGRNVASWTRDGSALVVAVSDNKGVSALQRLPISGGSPMTIATITGLRSFDISPDERRIAYSTDRPITDVWVLDLKAALK